MDQLTTGQKWSQLLLALAIVLGVGLGLHLLGAKAAPIGMLAAGMWASPYIELRTTGKQPKNLAVRQLAALGVTVAFGIIELIQWA